MTLSRDVTPYRENQKLLCDQHPRWIAVAPAVARNLAKSADSQLKKRLEIIRLRIRTNPEEWGGLEKNGRRERISGLSQRPAVRRFVREARGYWTSIRA